MMKPASKRLLSLLLIALTPCLLLWMTSCKNNGKIVTSATGTIYEILVVCNNNYWEGEQGDTLRAYLQADMPCMPQMEPYFSVSQVSWANFDDMLMPVRNILMVDVNPQKYTAAKLSYSTDLYAHPQAVARISAPSGEELQALINEKSKAIQTWFVRQELERQASFYKRFCNHEASDLILKKFGVQMYIPADYQLIKEDPDFVWCCNNNGPKRRDIVVYSYPYTDPNTFTKDYLLMMRDSVMHRIDGYVEGSYMGTEYKIFPPQFQAISVNDNAYCAEIRGLWRLKGGAAMGGPFVQHTRLDETHQRIVTAEAFVYAGGQQKRNVYRQAEAILYTMKMPEEINAIKEVKATGDK